MDTNKVNHHLKMMRKMLDDIDKIAAAEGLLSMSGSITALDQIVFQKAETWLNLMAGNIGGYAHEFDTYVKHRLQKRRTVTRGGSADITITDPVTGITKDVQLKSTIQDNAGAVNEMIAIAANQLSGERGETPLAHSRRVIDMMIRSESNSWPFTAWYGRGTKGEVEFCTEALKVVKASISTYRTHNTGAKVQGTGLSPTAIGKMHDVHQYSAHGPAGGSIVGVGPRSSARAYSNQVVLVNLIVKVRFAYPYPLLKPDRTFRFISEVKMEFDNVGGQLTNTRGCTLKDAV
jgi:hypothetical protein